MKSLLVAAVLLVVPSLCLPAEAPSSAQEPKNASIKVAIVLSERATVIDFAGPWEVFQDTMMEDSHGNHVMPFELYTVAPDKKPVHTSGSGRAGMTITPDYSSPTRRFPTSSSSARRQAARVWANGCKRCTPRTS